MKITFGFEWEIPILNTKFIPPNQDEVDELIFDLRNSIKGTNTGFDFLRYFQSHMLEFRSGILKNLKECDEIVEKFFERLNDYRKKTNFIFLTSGTYPFSGDTSGFHVHIGSFFSFEESFKYDKNLINYAPLFGALLANSPVYTKYMYGKWKSYRILFHAWWSSIPNFYQNDNFRFFIWGTDICNKVIIRPTIEIRIGDSPLCRNLITDYIFFCLGALLLNDEKIDEKRFEEYLINRVRIAKHGLQAKILWCGKEKGIDEVLIEKIDKIERRFSKRFNYRFKIIPEMVIKRITQADFAIKIFEEVKNDILNYILKIEKSFFLNKFLEYLKNLKGFEILDPPPLEEVIEEFLKRDIPIWVFASLIRLPLKEVERIIKGMEKKGKVKIKRDLRYGILVSGKDENRDF